MQRNDSASTPAPAHSEKSDKVTLDEMSRLMRIFLDIEDSANRGLERLNEGDTDWISADLEEAKQLAAKGLDLLRPQATPALNDQTRSVANRLQWAAHELEGETISKGLKDALECIDDAHEKLTGRPVFEKKAPDLGCTV